jgi:MFS family permease
MRRLLLLASAMIFFDVAFFAAIAPLLPDYVSDLDLSKAEAGVLSASYAAGTLIAALPAGFVASRVGPRRTVIAGLLLLGFSSLVFGLVHEIHLLDGARFIQGIAGALIWAGALTWLLTAAPEERRGSVIGTALGTAVAGALLGPVLGAIAASVGPSSAPCWSSPWPWPGRRRGWRRHGPRSARRSPKSRRRCSAGRSATRPSSSPFPR